MAGDSYEDKITGGPFEFFSKAPGIRARIVLAGPFLNYVLGFLLFSIVFMIGNPMLTSKIGGLVEEYPAQSSGLQKGDRIIAIDGTEVGFWEEITKIIHHKTDGNPVQIRVARSGREIDFSIKPKVDVRKDVFGTERKIALIGIKPGDEIISVQHNPVEAIYLGAKRIGFLTVMTCKALAYIVIGRMSLKESITGPVGIFVLTGKAAELGIVYLLQMMAVLSASLAIFNVLPIPVLDGGHILFIAIERMRKKAVSPKVQEVATQVGLYVLIALMFLVFYSDFIKFGIFDKIVNIFKG
jgi:regulator of sigma E protease